MSVTLRGVVVGRQEKQPGKPEVVQIRLWVDDFTFTDFVIRNTREWRQGDNVEVTIATKGDAA